MKKLVIGSFKGGVGKTTVAVNLAVVLASAYRLRVLLIDADPSANVSAHFRVKPELALYHVLVDGFTPDQVMVHLKNFGELYLLPSSRATQAAEFQIATELGREHVLSDRLSAVNGFDYVLVDTSPSMSIMAQNAFVYARQILIPVSMDPMSLLGASSSLGLAAEIKEKLKIDYSILGIVPTFVDERLIITRVVMEAIGEKYPGVPVLPAIRNDTGVRKSTACGVPVVEYDRTSRAAEDFFRLAKAIVQSRPT
ncbi:MAG: ParA family protein [Acidobacteria bacterium]|nr:ParA family protein [Acidobacteriota bacterium]